MSKVERRVQEFMDILGLMPWDKWAERQRDKIDTDHVLSSEAKKVMLSEARQTGRTTKGILYAIALAEERKLPLIVIGRSDTGGLLLRRAHDIRDRVKAEVSIQLSSTKYALVYIDHIAGEACPI